MESSHMWWRCCHLASPSYQVPFFFFSLTHFLCPISYWLRAFKKQERKGSLKEGSLAATGYI